MKLARARHVRPELDAPLTTVSPSVPDDLSIEPHGTRLGERLVDAGIATRESVEAALAEAQRGTGLRLGELLLARLVITESDLARVLAEQHDVPLVDFRVETPVPGAVALLDEVTARRLLALPLSIDGDTVRVAVADPTPEHVDHVRRALGREVAIGTATPADITHTIGSAYRALSGVDTQVREFEARDALRREAAQLEAVSVNEDAPVVRVAQMIITQALRDRASDIHVEPQGERIRVRYRIDGALNEVLTLPGSIGPALVSRIKILAGMNIVERRRPQDGQIGMAIEGRAVDIRVSTTATVSGEKVVMRLLDKSKQMLQLPQLGLPADLTGRYSELLHSPYGMVVCAGPTGSGKTTTLYASLAELDSPERNIMTIEDPVEYTFDTINQISINEQAGVTFSNGLRSILRQDPDVILVGEIRDVDTARIAVQSALTGHFVLSSLHATDAVAALYRLLDMGIEPFLIASSITSVVAQRLVRRSCTYCLAPYQPAAEELAFLRGVGGAEPVEGFQRGTGCNFCAQTGYLERIGVYELMVVGDEIREMIIRRPSHDEMRKLARSRGMRTLQEEALQLVEAGVTTVAELMRSIYVAGM